MSLYHFHVTQIGRSKGHSAVAAAAYRSGEKIYDDYYGETQDYTKKGGVVKTEILLPDYAPERFKDRSMLWNELESIEKHPKAQLAYSFDMALQHELTDEENIALGERFVREEMVARGMICDVAFYMPGKSDDDIKNFHMHVLSPIRPFLPEGRWGEKQHREYVLDENGERMRDEDGEYIFNSRPTTEWGSPELLDHWRERWAQIVNEEFEKRGISERVDHRSYVDQGLDLIPQVHEGAAVRKMEARGIVTRKGDLNRFINSTNKLLRDTIRKLKDLAQWFKAIKPQLDRLNDPTLHNLIVEYFDYRNEVAETYTRGTHSAKNKNLKLMAKIIAYIEDRKLYTPQELERRIKDLQGRADFKSVTLSNLKKEVKEYTDKVKYAGFLEETRSIYEESQKIFFPGTKKKFQQEHDKELKRYHVAANYFAGKVTTEDPEFFLSGWKKELEAKKADYETEANEMKALRSEIRQLQEIKKAIDYAVAKRNGEDPKLPMVYMEEDEVEKAMRTKGRETQMHHKEAISKARDVMEEIEESKRNSKEFQEKQADKQDKKKRKGVDDD